MPHLIFKGMNTDIIGTLQSYIIPPTSGIDTPKNAVILVHGYGANGRDLIGLGAEWAPHCPDTLFISPDAPHICEASALGRQWFSLREFSEDFMEAQIAKAWQDLSDYIDAVMDAYSLAADQILLCGFSQGTMMSIYTALQRPHPCAGILGYSGLILGQDILKNTAHKDLPIMMIHGDDDPVIPVNQFHAAMAFLQENNFTAAQGHTSAGLAHNINAQGVKDGLDFIQQRFS